MIDYDDTIGLGDAAADRRVFDAMVAVRVCLERRKTVANGGTFEQQAFAVYVNSHRFRRRGIDGKVWRFTGRQQREAA